MRTEEVKAGAEGVLTYNRTAVDPSLVTSEFKEGLMALRKDRPEALAKELSEKLNKKIAVGCARPNLRRNRLRVRRTPPAAIGPFRRRHLGDVPFVRHRRLRPNLRRRNRRRAFGRPREGRVCCVVEIDLACRIIAKAPTQNASPAHYGSRSIYRGWNGERQSL